MAEIHFTDLIQLIKSNNKYLELHEQGVPIEKAFYISVSEKTTKESITTEEYVLSNGLILTLDIDSQNFVIGFEIS